MFHLLIVIIHSSKLYHKLFLAKQEFNNCLSKDIKSENTIAKKEASQKNRREDLCKNNKTLSLVWGGDCSDSESGYWYSGRCNPCPQNQQLDLNGVCCFPNNMNACGYCPPKPNQQQRSCCRSLKCRNSEQRNIQPRITKRKLFQTSSLY